MGLWVVLLVIGFAVGTFMGLKPKPHETRLAKLRLIARQQQLIPKLIPTPEWLTPPKSISMVAQYSIICDDWQLPHQIINATDVPLPNDISSYCIAIMLKANSISLYWLDNDYAYSFAIKDNMVNDKMMQTITNLYQILCALAIQKNKAHSIP